MAKFQDRCYAPEDLKKTHEILLEILKETLRVCKKNNLPVAVCFGTAIGTVRHKGFIPWDDDIDLVLLRKDYDRLIEIMPTELSGRFCCDDWLHNKDFPAPNACVYAKGTVAVPMEMKNCKYRYGISLGIYPYDNVSDDPKIAKKQYRYCWLFGRLHWLKMLPFPYLPFHGIKKRIIHLICGAVHLALSPIPKRWLVNKCEKYLRLCNDEETKCVSILLDNTPEKTTIEREKLFPFIDGEFEGLPVKLVNCNHEALTRYYDFPYMELPPEKERKNHFPCEMDFGDF